MMYDHGLWIERDAAGCWQFRCRYTLEGYYDTDASGVVLDLLDPNLNVVASVPGDPSVGVRHTQTVLTLPPGQTPVRGKYQLLLRAADNHGADTPFTNRWHPSAYRSATNHRLAARSATTWWTESRAWVKLYKDEAMTQEWPPGSQSADTVGWGSTWTSTHTTGCGT